MTARPNARTLLAGDVAKQLSIGVQTLHYYEREGLIPAPERTEAGYRLYTAELIERIAFIRKAQALGLPLEGIKEILDLAEQGACPCGHVQRALSGKLVEVNQKLRQLRSFQRELVALIERSGELSARCDEARICSIVEDASPLHGASQVTIPLTPKRA